MKLKLATTLLFTSLCAANAADKQGASARIDALIEKNYAPNEIQPNPLTSDSTFVRRVYLDIAGRIPTASEAREFISSMEPAKRTDLIDQLLDSDGYVSHQFNYWADVLRINSRMNGQGPQNGAAYINWVKGAISKNMPYDEFVTALVTAEGMVDENGAAGFYLRDRGMPLDHLATTVQVFLGTQMVCAQCHDHPFDEWTQMDYYQLAAFSSPMEVVRNPPSVTRAIGMVNQEAREEQRQLNDARQVAKRNKRKRNESSDNKRKRSIQNEARATTRALTAISYNFRNSVIGETEKKLKLPHDYQYNDGEPEEVINPLTPFGDRITVEDGQSRIEAYGKWMTSEKNPRFTKTIANRLWKRVMGIGLIEPVDNLTAETEPTNPELMAELEKLLIDLDYDLKEYYRVLYNTKTYQREASSADMLAKYYYPGPRLRRMSAEQVWDSLITLVREEPDTATDPRAQKYGSDSSRIKAWQRIRSQSPAHLLTRQEALDNFPQRSTQKLEQMRELAEQAIAKKDQKQARDLGQELINFNQKATREYARLTYWDMESFGNRYFQTPFRNVPTSLYRQLKTGVPKAGLNDERAFRNPFGPMTDSAMMGGRDRRERGMDKAQMKRLREKMGKDAFNKMLRERSAKGRLNNFVRASEISSPAPDGHFLRTFGQSDRQLIENANDEASVPQSLALMNGTLFTAIGDPFSVVAGEALAQKDDDDTVDSIYLSMLARKADSQEQSLLRSEFEQSQNRTEAVRGIIWTVLNTQQFLFVE
ncbi:MAG: DUF1549 domain-containing protein [Verrucomicrobiales bacterium]